MWDLLEVIHGRPFSAKTRVIDPACGEGVFLRVALERGQIVPERVFGADIDETLAPRWRGDPLLKATHLWVANGLLDFPDRGVRAGAFEVVVGNPPFGGQGLRDLLRLLDEPELASATPETDLFGALVMQERPAPAGPPLQPQERSQLDQLARQLGRHACWRLSKDTENGDVETTGASPADEWFARTGDKRKSGSDEFAKAAEMVAAWPLHRPLDPKRPETRLLLRKLASTAIEVFFVERFLRLTTPGGLIAMIVPESVVASDQLGPLRTWLLTEMDLLAVVSLPQKVFAGVGANARTSVVLARRLLQPRKAEADGGAAPQNDPVEAPEDPGAGPKVLMAAPNLDAPGFSLEHYLEVVLQDAREGANTFPTGKLGS